MSIVLDRNWLKFLNRAMTFKEPPYPAGRAGSHGDELTAKVRIVQAASDTIESELRKKYVDYDAVWQLVFFVIASTICFNLDYISLADKCLVYGTYAAMCARETGEDVLSLMTHYEARLQDTKLSQSGWLDIEAFAETVERDRGTSDDRMVKNMARAVHSATASAVNSLFRMTQ